MDHSKPLVVVVVLNWNGRRDTEECLASLRKVTYGRFKVLLVDNASSDDSVPFVEEHFPEAEVVANAENLGFTGGNNVGMRRALEMGADWALLLNNDTTVEPEFLTTLVSAAQADPRIGVIGPLINYYDPKDRVWFAGGRLSLTWGFSWHVGNRATDRGQYRGCIDEDFQTGAAMMISRRVLDEVGLLDEGLFIYFEDTDLSVRARKAGHRVVCCRDARIHHKISRAGGGGLTPAKAYTKVISGAMFFRRHSGPWRYHTTVALFNYAYAAATALTKLLSGRWDVVRAIVRGFWHVLRGRNLAARAWKGR